tara:strand:+ start:350 stop:721 length:372 start_codon:yes stop_codon:yes gene_type:complete
MSTADDFLKSEVIKEELDDLQRTYTELLSMSQEFSSYDTEGQLDHINKTLELIAKQKVFYARLQLMEQHITYEEDEKDSEVMDMKKRIDNVSGMYSGGKNLLEILEAMETKLLQWKSALLDKT